MNKEEKISRVKELSKLDYKWIGIIIIMCLGFSAMGYGFMLLTQALNNPEKVKSFDCNTLTETQWHNDFSGSNYKTLDEYKKFCEVDKNTTLQTPNLVGIIFIIIIPIISGLIISKVTGIHKDEEDGLIK